MAWVAEILRRDHRTCEECGVGPTHIYDPEIAALPESELDPEAEAPGTPLCNACLTMRLEEDLVTSEGRVVVFEPALGPDAFIFHAAGDGRRRAWSESERETMRAILDRLARVCSRCDQPGRFLWVPVERDANLWLEDWLPCLAQGRLTPGETLCGRCTARRLGQTLEERGLFFDAIVPPRHGDGIFCGSEL